MNSQTLEPSHRIDTPWLTVVDAAEYARRSRRTIEGWIYRGEIRVYKPDGRPLLKKSDIDKKIEDSVIEPRATGEPVVKDNRGRKPQKAREKTL